MKIYVDEMPKYCAECPYCNYNCIDAIYTCMFTTTDMDCGGIAEKSRSEDCPLQSIADHDAELLKNAIVPKFKVGEKVFYIDDIAVWYGTVFNVRYHGDGIYADTDKFRYEILPYLDLETKLYDEKNLFATREEAEQKLKEIKGEN